MRSLVKIYSMDKNITQYWTKEMSKEFCDIQQAILSKLLSRCILAAKRVDLKTNFSKLGMGYVLCQPGDKTEALAAMQRKDSGSNCNFDLIIHGLRLFPCRFGSLCNSKRESWLHSYINKAKAF